MEHVSMRSIQFLPWHHVTCSSGKTAGLQLPRNPRQGTCFSASAEPAPALVIKMAEAPGRKAICQTP